MACIQNQEDDNIEGTSIIRVKGKNYEETIVVFEAVVAVFVYKSIS